jgi:hypothetical protein
MRIYNPTLGRFLSVDPVSAKFPWLTPYQFASNRPILAIDLDGLEAYDAPNSSNVFSMSNWRGFVKSYSNKLVSDQKIQKIDDKDCADLAIEMVAVYHKNMGVPLAVTIKYDNGKSVTIDSNDPKYQDNLKKDASGKEYSKFDWYLDDLKKSVGPNGIAQIAYSIPGSQAGTGDVALYKSSTEGSNGFFHTQVLNDDFTENGSNMGYIQASGHYYGRGNSNNMLDNPLISTGGFNTNGYPYLYRFNFLKNVPNMTAEEMPTKIEPIQAKINLNGNMPEPELR